MLVCALMLTSKRPIEKQSFIAGQLHEGLAWPRHFTWLASGSPPPTAGPDGQPRSGLKATKDENGIVKPVSVDNK
jgi:hypothetical protein